MNWRQFHVSLFVFLFFFSFHSYGQESPCHLSLAGVVKDSLTGEELPGATIYIKNLNQGVSSDLSGRFVLESLCPGTYELEIRFIGYVSLVQKVEVSHSTQLKFLLTQESISLDDVVIEGHKEEILNAQPVINLNRKELEKISGQSLAQTLSTIAGVNMLQTGSTIAKPVIHGMHSNRVLLLLNGLRHEGQQWGFEHAPEIDPFLATEISVIKGAAGVQYGPDAIAGVVLINTPQLPENSGMEGSAHAVGASNGRSGTFSANLQGGLKNLKGIGWRIQGTLKKAGNLKAPDYYLSNTGVEERDFSAAVGFKNKKWGTELFYSSFNTELGILAASHVNNLTDLENALERGEPFDADSAEFSYSIARPFQKVDHNFWSVKSFFRFNKAAQLHLSYGYQINHREEYDRVRQSISGSGEPQLDFTLNTHNLDVHFDHRLFEIFTGSVGFTGQQQSNVFQGRQLIPNFKSYSGGLYLIEHYIKQNYELEVGFRYDYKFIETFRNENGQVLSDEFEFSNFTAVIGGIYQMNRDLNVRLNLSTAWRPPNINELFSDGVHQGVASYEIGDPTLDSEKSFNTSLSFNLSKSKIAAEFTAYYQYIRDFIFLEPQYPETVLTIRGAFPLFEYKQVDARFAGFDVSAIIKLGQSLDWNVKGSLVRARDLTNEEDLIWIPPDRIENKFTYHFKTAKNTEAPYLGIGLTSVREQTKYPSNTDFAEPPKGYHLIGAETGTEVIIGQHELGINFAVNNLLNTSYREYMNRFRYFADEPGINFILRLNYNF